MKDKFINLKNTIFSFFKTNKNVAIILTIALIVIICAIILILATNKTEIGNTSGNLNNLGFAVEKNNSVYYLGFKDSNTDGIYKINSGNNIEKISSDYALYLNKSGKYLYYLDKTAGNNNIVRINANGQDKEIIEHDVDTAKVTVIDNWIYYFKESKLYKVKTNGQDKQILLSESIQNYEIEGKWIYYSYVNNRKYIIAKITTNGEDRTIIDNDSARQFFVNKNNIYYIYENQNEEKTQDGYELYKIESNGKNKQKIANLDGNIQLESINFSKNKIYYTKSDENGNLAIYSISLKGENETKITDIKNTYTKMNIQNNCIYYIDENENGDSEMFKIEADGKGKKALSI